MVVALALVGAVGVGATLAYLSDTTGTLTNTFTVGSGIDITQDEEKVDFDDDNDGKVDDEFKGDRTESGNDYTDIQPGEVLVKDPTVRIKEGSTECYVFMKLAGANELTAQNFEITGFDDTKWIKCDGTTGLNGVYRYYTTVTAPADNGDDEVDYISLEPLFTTVTYSTEVDEVETADLAEVTVMSCEVQAANMADAAAYAATVWE